MGIVRWIAVPGLDWCSPPGRWPPSQAPTRQPRRPWLPRSETAATGTHTLLREALSCDVRVARLPHAGSGPPPVPTKAGRLAFALDACLFGRVWSLPEVTCAEDPFARVVAEAELSQEKLLAAFEHAGIGGTDCRTAVRCGHRTCRRLTAFHRADESSVRPERIASEPERTWSKAIARPGPWRRQDRTRLRVRARALRSTASLPLLDDDWTRATKTWTCWGRGA